MHGLARSHCLNWPSLGHWQSLRSSLATVKPLGGIGTVQTSKRVKGISRIQLIAEEIKHRYCSSTGNTSLQLVEGRLVSGPS